MTRFDKNLIQLFDRKHHSKNFYFIFVSIILTLCYGCADKKTDTNSNKTQEAFHISAISKQQLFRVEFQTEKEIKLPINQFHNWVITVKDENDLPVYPALFSLSGGMPSHGHGLPTEPKVTKHLENGQYLLEGVKFNMDGQWTFRLNVSTRDRQDSVEINFEVSY